MGKHAAGSSRVPRAAVVLGLFLALVLAGGLTANAVGAFDRGEPDATGSPSAAPDGSASPSDGATATDDVGTDGADGTDGSARADKARRLKVRLPDDVVPDLEGGAGQKTTKSQKELASAVEDLLAEPDVQPTAFRVASFNVLGNSHTVAGGNKRGYAGGVARTGMAVQVLRSLQVDLVGFQELEPVQNAAVLRMTGGGMQTYPGMRLGTKGVRNSVGWRTDTWDLVTARTIPIPYFRGNRVPMPYVLLQHKRTGQRVWVINIHNPTSNPRRGNNERWRDLGTRLQAALVSRLHAATDLPVILMGDFNERGEAYCTVTARAPVTAANGGGPGCRPPAGAGIDWIFGTRDMEFANYARIRSGLVARATDHPVIVTDALITPPEQTQQ